MAEIPPPARYFPVGSQPYRMSAGLLPFGGYLGNGDRDRLYFQRDSEAERYRAVKSTVPPGRYRVVDSDEPAHAAHAAVLAWMEETLRREHPALLSTEEQTYESIALSVQEDFAVIQRPVGERDRAIAVFVACPSGWRPESIAGFGFKQVHEPVPAFGESDAANDSMLTAMIERGPYGRFVWTISADDHLDHHPEQGRRESWAEDGSGWLRVERQVTVPFPSVDAALFLIRTYLYPFESLDPEQRQTLARALEQMPPEIAAYKSLDDGIRDIAERQLRL